MLASKGLLDRKSYYQGGQIRWWAKAFAHVSLLTHLMAHMVRNLTEIPKLWMTIVILLHQDSSIHSFGQNKLKISTAGLTLSYCCNLWELPNFNLSWQSPPKDVMKILFLKKEERKCCRFGYALENAVDLVMLWPFFHSSEETNCFAATLLVP